jgi:hypothetical protein
MHQELFLSSIGKNDLRVAEPCPHHHQRDCAECSIPALFFAEDVSQSVLRSMPDASGRRMKSVCPVSACLRLQIVTDSTSVPQHGS